MQAAGPNRSLEQADGVAFLERNLHTDQEPDWIIPALPIHLAAEWCLVRQKPATAWPYPITGRIQAASPQPHGGI